MTTNEQAAARVLKVIGEKKLLSPENLQSLTLKFGSGRMASSDWTVLVRTEIAARNSNAKAKT
jgi:hypothetical protein